MPLKILRNDITKVHADAAVLTQGFDLPAKYIIHTAGPVWYGGQQGEEKLLSDCYKNSLALARKNKLESIAFPLISAGIYRFPKDKALTIAFAEIGSFLRENDMAVYLVVFDQETFDLAEKLYYRGGFGC